MYRQSIMRICGNCGRDCPNWFAKGLCKTCYSHFRRHGSDRPIKLSPSQRRCIACGRLGIEGNKRCARCYAYRKTHGVDRPDSLDKMQRAREDGMRYCPHCDRTLSLDNFYLQRRDGWQGECRDCALARKRRISAERRATREPIMRECAYCGGSFAVSIYRRDAKYCSRSCNHNHWNKTNPERRKDIKHLRYARERGAMDGVIVDRQAIFERDNWMCQLCGHPVDPTIPVGHRLSKTLDHIIPISKGGKHTPDNLQLAHASCNSSKKDRLT